MKDFINGYVCRSKNSDTVAIATGFKLPEIKENGWFRYIPGWFHSIHIRTFKKKFGFSVKPGTYELINITISRK